MDDYSLTTEEEMELWRKVAEGDEYAIKRIAEAYLYLLPRVAAKLRNIGYYSEDMEQEGFWGLYRAIKYYRPEKSIRFSTYAWIIISKEMLKSIGKNTLIPLPQNLYREYKKFKAALDDLSKIRTSTPTSEELSETTGFTVEKLEFFRNIVKPNSEVISIDEPTHTDGASSKQTISDIIPDTKPLPPDLIDKEKDKLKDLQENLNEKLEKMNLKTQREKYLYTIGGRDLKEVLIKVKMDVKEKEDALKRIFRKQRIPDVYEMRSFFFKISNDIELLDFLYMFTSSYSDPYANRLHWLEEIAELKVNKSMYLQP